MARIVSAPDGRTTARAHRLCCSIIAVIILSVGGVAADVQRSLPTIMRKENLRVSASRGQPGADGSITHPFRSIAECVAAANPGSSCEIEPGVYHESVKTPPGVSLRGLGDGPMLSGVRYILSKWIDTGSGIWETTLGPEFPDEVAQVFIQNGNQLETAFEARWPNMNLTDVLDPNVSMAKVGKGSEYGKICSAELAKSGVTNWTGALATLNVAHQFLTWTRNVENYTAATGCFTYPQNLPGLANWPAQWWSTNRFALQGIRSALDVPKEWIWDAERRALAIMLPNARMPLPSEVAVRVRDYCVDAGDSISNLQFFGCTFTVDCEAGCFVDNVTVNYPTLSRTIPESYPKGDPKFGRANQTTVAGQSTTVRNVSIANTNVGGLVLAGKDIMASELLVESTNWFGTLNFGAIVVAGERTNVTRFTARFSGNAAVHSSCMRPGGFCNHSFTYGHIHHGGMVGLDSANLYTSGAQDSGTLWFRCWVHHAREKVARFDDQSNHVTAVQLVLFNGGTPVGDSRHAGLGFTLKGNDNTAVGLTSFNNSEFDMNVLGCTSLVKPWIPNQGPRYLHQNNGSNIVNVAYNTNGSVGDCNKSLPISVGGTWLGQVQTVQPLWHYLEDPANYNFTPKAGSRLVDAGVEYPPWTDGFIGAAPDAGAYERGADYWVPGCSSRPQCFDGEPPIMQRVLG